MFAAASNGCIFPVPVPVPGPEPRSGASRELRPRRIQFTPNRAQPIPSRLYDGRLTAHYAPMPSLQATPQRAPEPLNGKQPDNLAPAGIPRCARTTRPRTAHRPHKNQEPHEPQNPHESLATAMQPQCIRNAAVSAQTAVGWPSVLAAPIHSATHGTHQRPPGNSQAARGYPTGSPRLSHRQPPGNPQQPMAAGPPQTLPPQHHSWQQPSEPRWRIVSNGQLTSVPLPA